MAQKECPQRSSVVLSLWPRPSQGDHLCLGKWNPSFWWASTRIMSRSLVIYLTFRQTPLWPSFPFVSVLTWFSLSQSPSCLKHPPGQINNWSLTSWAPGRISPQVLLGGEHICSDENFRHHNKLWWLYAIVLLCNTRSQAFFFNCLKTKFEPGDIPYTMKKRAGAVTTCWDTTGDSMAPGLLEFPRELHMYRENVCLCRCVGVGVEGWCPRPHVHLSCLNLSVSLLVLTTRAVWLMMWHLYKTNIIQQEQEI